MAGWTIDQRLANCRGEIVTDDYLASFTNHFDVDLSQDMELYRKANVFERILSLYCSPQISTKAQHKVLEVVYRAVQVGGSMTLITRAGILSWIDIQVLSDTKYTRVLQALKSALEGSSDPMEVEAWKTRSAKQ